MKTIPLILAALVLCGCENNERRKWKYSYGEIVESVIDGRRGQVLDIYESTGRYRVRFSGGMVHVVDEIELRSIK